MEFSVLEFDRTKFETLPSFLQEMITGSKEYQAMMKAPVALAPAVATPTPAQQQEMLYAQHQAQVAAQVESFEDQLPF
jgi:hypothetical protein